MRQERGGRTNEKEEIRKEGGEGGISGTAEMEIESVLSSSVCVCTCTTNVRVTYVVRYIPPCAKDPV